FMFVRVRRGRLLFALMGLGAAVFISGCGPGNPLGRKAVSGTVTLDGAPVQQGSISFQPTHGEGTSSGAMILGGKYSIEAVDGLADGTYLVQINAIDPSTIAELSADHMPGDDLPEA